MSPMGHSVLTPGLVGRQTRSSVRFDKCYDRTGPKEGVMDMPWG